MTASKRHSPLERNVRILFSCEHGGADIPPRYRSLFKNAKQVLRTHRGLDIGALAIAKILARRTRASLDYSTISRLVVDLNRSVTSKGLFSSFTQNLNDTEKRLILNYHYNPYRQRFEKRVASVIRDGNCVLHISIHSFTPILNGEKRKADLAILYDPKRPGEKRFSDAWLETLQTTFPELAIRRNNPYKGSSDGFTRTLRRLHGAKHYIGIELEMNQRIVGAFKTSTQREQFSKRLYESLMAALERL